MKLIISCVIIVINISTNGKASVDTLVPVISNSLHEDVSKLTENTSCYRPCKFNVKPRRCHYVFDVRASINADSKPVIAINDSLPGPAIHVCYNDIIIVEVKNKIPDEDLAIHWHGVNQIDTPYMDGVPMITQCPINYGSTYKYAFRASKPGTYFYHAHSVSHHSDGVFGALVVNQPAPLDPHHALYDYDRSDENTLLLSASFPKLFTSSLAELNLMKPTSLEVNGRSDYKIFMIEGYAYRLRLINAVAVECPIVVSVDKHEMIIIASDSSSVKPEPATKVLLYPGERMDVVVRASQQPGGYWLHIHGRGKCDGLQARTAVVYTGTNYTATVPIPQNIDESEFDAKDSAIYGQILESFRDNSFQKLSVTKYYLGIDRSVMDKDIINDFRYISDALPKKPYYPAALSIRDKGVVQINGKSFLYPNEPFLLKQEKIPRGLSCPIGLEKEHADQQCVQILEAEKDETVEILLVNEGLHSNDSYTFHVHGYNMQILATGLETSGKPLCREEFMNMEQKGEISRNMVNPPLKDSVLVPNKGYTIVRLKLDNPGSWLLECRSCEVSSLPTAILINVAHTIPNSVIDVLSKCGSYRPPDVLLN